MRSIPAIEDDAGNKLQISIKIQNYSTVFILIKLTDKSHQMIGLQHLQKLQLSFFVKEYYKFVESGNYRKTNSTLGIIKSAFQTIGILLRTRQVSKFYISMNYGFPWTILDIFLTLDKYDDTVIGITHIRNNQITNVIDPNVERLSYNFHSNTVKMIYDVYSTEDKNQIFIFEKMVHYLRFLIPSLIMIFLIKDITTGLLINPFNSIQFYIYGLLALISFFPKSIFKFIIKTYLDRELIMSKIQKLANSIKNLLKVFKSW